VDDLSRDERFRQFLGVERNMVAITTDLKTKGMALRIGRCCAAVFDKASLAAGPKSQVTGFLV